MKHNLYFDLLGVHIEHFITSKWTNKTRAAKILGITQNRISEMISGARPANPKIMQTLHRFGFDMIHYERYLGVDHIEPDNLSKKEIFELFADAKLLIRQQAEVIKILKDQLEKRE